MPGLRLVPRNLHGDHSSAFLHHEVHLASVATPVADLAEATAIRRVCRARALVARSPNADAFGVLSDALLELGDYDGSLDAAQSMIDLRPDGASYVRAASSSCPMAQCR